MVVFINFVMAFEGIYKRYIKKIMHDAKMFDQEKSNVGSTCPKKKLFCVIKICSGIQLYL